ncbi:hypothetical protein V3W47_13135 [Deinococcus sp. YIM 134068]|uniref:hypothetical protein n=1 Tax=Deinococcus lichenicola TaxID=3118910 RepID=UPI002F9246BB
MSRPALRLPENLKLQGLKLSREMKVLLILLLLVALVGGGYMWLGGRQTDDALAQTVDQTAGTDAPDPEGTPTANGGPAAPGVTVQPEGQVEVPSIPAFGEDPATAPGGEETPAPATPAPGGINPDTPLAALPSRNPFRPVELDGSATPETAQATSPVTPPAVTPAPVTPAFVPPAPVTATPVTLTRPPVSVVERNAAPVSKPVSVAAVTPLPRTGVRVEVLSAPVSGGAFPTPTPAGARVVTLPPATPAAVPTPAPVRPPVAGVRVPGGTFDLGALLGRRATVETPAAPATATPVPPTPALPQPITHLGADGAAAEVPLSPLADLVRRRELAFDAGVLGPVNTAILRSKDGFLVVSAGQTLPDSSVTVRDVTATGATLALGTETHLLNLDSSTEGEP